MTKLERVMLANLIQSAMVCVCNQFHNKDFIEPASSEELAGSMMTFSEDYEKFINAE